VPDAGRRLVLIRGWQTSTLLVKNGEFTAAEIESVKQFCRERSFDTAWFPGIEAVDANRFNVLQRPWFYEGAKALLGPGAQAFMEDYKFDLRPATDDRPYFFHFFKWRSLGEILELRGRGGMSLLEWGYLVPVATLAQALLASAILILGPLLLLRRDDLMRAPGTGRLRVLVYFFAIGVAFLFMEIAFIQKLILFLHHPVYAVAVVLSTFLVFAGLGSLWSERAAARYEYGGAVVRAVAAIVVLGLASVYLLDQAHPALAPLPAAARTAAAVGLIAPLAFFMGMPFPLAMARLGEESPALMPWAWGVNGCASVLSAVVATLLAIQWGFTLVVLAALALYGLAAVALGGRGADRASS